MHEPMMRPNFTPLYIERDITRGDALSGPMQRELEAERRVSGY